MCKFIFDVDGTLTPSRGEINYEFCEWLQSFAAHNDMYVVTGGTKEHTVQQIGTTLWNKCKRNYQCSGNIVYEKGDVVSQNNIELTDEMQKFFEYWLKASQFKHRTGQHIDVRPGLINFSTIGRGCNREQRAEYVRYDNSIKERQIIAQYFNGAFGNKLVAQVAGETGIDIMMIGKDKSQIIKDFTEEDEIHFFGDKTMEGGNDYTLAKAVKAKGDYVYQVNDWKETWGILKSLEAHND
jgi:phosphomannomutase